MNKTLSLLGLARRAGRLSLGHDSVIAAVKAGMAKAVILTCDASPGHRRELEGIGFNGRIHELNITSEEAGIALGKRCCIYSVNDEGFADAVAKTV